VTEKLPPPWLRVRDAAEIAREVEQLLQMQNFERHAIKCGINIRPKLKEKPDDRIQAGP
jgi:hypothetical protein